MLKSTDRRNSFSLDGSTPLQIGQVKNEEIVEPVLAIAAPKHKHHVFYDGGRVKLPHGSFTPYDTRNVERQFFDAVFEINENDVGKDLEAVPTAVDNNLRPVPKLARMTHPWLRQFMFVNLGLKPVLFF